MTNRSISLAFGAAALLLSTGCDGMLTEGERKAIEEAVSPEAAAAPPERGAGPDLFLAGQFITSNEVPVATIAVGLPPTMNRLFRLGEPRTFEKPDVEHTILTDRAALAAGSLEGSTAVVESANIDVRQGKAGVMMSVGWAALVQPVEEGGYAKTQWLAEPGRPALIADLDGKKKRLFVLHYAGATVCQAGRAKVTVDGKLLKNKAGSDVVMLPGSSLMSLASSSIVIQAEGNCPVNNPDRLGGTLKIAIAGSA